MENKLNNIKNGEMSVTLSFFHSILLFTLILNVAIKNGTKVKLFLASTRVWYTPTSLPRVNVRIYLFDIF